MNEPVAGKFLLEILTKGMYSNPLHIYREYIQNASDSIDKAISKGLICPGDAEVHISVDWSSRWTKEYLLYHLESFDIWNLNSFRVVYNTYDSKNHAAFEGLWVRIEQR